MALDRSLPIRVSGGHVFLSSINALIILSAAVLLPFQVGAPRKFTAPETFVGKAETRTPEGAMASAPLTIQIDRYTLDGHRKVMEEALRTGGYPGFLAALRNAPAVGHVQAGERKVTVRWAHQVPDGETRTISVVTDAPLFFIGGGRPDAKPRAGYELAVLQLKMDSSGIGEGTLAAAARVKRGGATGVEVDEYADQPIKLVSIRREIK
jgi:hypothetical protein